MQRQATPFQCPGEGQPISRAVHLARLASFYPGCRQCLHREETATLSPLVIEQLKETRQRGEPVTLFHDEGLAGTCNDLGPAAVRDAAAAFGALVRRTCTSRNAMAVVLAADGRPTTADLVAAASAGLRWSGCEVVEIGAATAPCVAFAVGHLAADGGLFVGNPRGEAHTVGLKFWERSGRPISAGDQLEVLQALLAQPQQRAGRTLPAARRYSVEQAYRARLEPYFHALRPLRFVLDTTCMPLWWWLGELATNVDLSALRSAAEPIARRRTAGEPAKSLSALQQRLASVARQVRKEQAHFGIWIDGDGECCQVIDETGALIPPDRLLAVLAGAAAATRAVVVEESTPGEIRDRISVHSPVVSSPASRARMFDAMQSSRAWLGGGPSGRFWFFDSLSEAGAEPTVPVVDALELLSVLLSVLSQSDRPLSKYEPNESKSVSSTGALRGLSSPAQV